MSKSLFVSTQPKAEQETYKRYLRAVGALSQLFSESDVPYLYYRGMEKIFCHAFHAKDLSRTDFSVDARIGKLGIGLKTFIRSSPPQKIAEFNAAKKQYDKLSPEKAVIKIAELRNLRLQLTSSAFGIEKSIYHCILRDDAGFHILEEPMVPIQIESIKKITPKDASVSFSDGIHDYNFNYSKSTLFKRFIEPQRLISFSVQIAKDPFELLDSILEGHVLASVAHQHIFLPLYSPKQGDVPTQSGLNQWNAKGRTRDPDEVYIPIPSWIHATFPGFFPGREEPFQLRLPDGNSLNAKICQDGGKALMSDPNKALGKWLLRDLLKIPQGTLVTMDILNNLGFDSVRIDKVSKNTFEINFSKTGSYSVFSSATARTDLI
jgi:hypothetical protein